MRVLLLLATVVAIDATASVVDRPKDSCLLQLATTHTKKMAAAIEEEDAAPEAFAEDAVVRSNENSHSVKPVFPQPLMLASTEGSENKSEISEANAGYTQALDQRRSEPLVGHVTLGDYPRYIGELKVQGNMTILPFFDKLLLQWNLEGVDKYCSKDAKNPIENACGIHIHEGTNCTDPNLVGEVYYKATANPWTLFNYQATDSGQSDGGGSIYIGKTLADVMAHSVVIHDSAGKRIACGLIHAGKLIACDNSGTSAPRSHFAFLLMLITIVLGIHA